MKVPLICGVKTNVVTAVEIGDREANDAPFLPALVQSTSLNFKISEVCADKAYGGRRNVEAIEAAGGTPFIAVKSNATGEVGGGWEKMVRQFGQEDDITVPTLSWQRAEAIANAELSVPSLSV